MWCCRVCTLLTLFSKKVGSDEDHAEEEEERDEEDQEQAEEDEPGTEDASSDANKPDDTSCDSPKPPPTPVVTPQIKKKKRANLMDKINKLSSAAIHGDSDTDSKTAKEKAGIISDLLGIQTATIDKIFSSPKNAAEILGVDDEKDD